MFVPSCGQSWECGIIVLITETHFENVVKGIFMTLYLSLVDHALHHDAGLHPQRCGGLCCGCLLWTQRGCLAPAAMVRH